MAMSASDVKERIKLTTEGQPGTRTLETGLRVTGQQTLEQGAGMVNAARYVSGSETSILNGETAATAAGISGFLLLPTLREGPSASGR